MSVSLQGWISRWKPWWWTVFQLCCSYGTQLDRRGKISAAKFKMKHTTKTYLYSMVWTLKAVTHQTDIKEQASMKLTVSLPCVDCVWAKTLCLNTAKITANGQLAPTFCACMKGKNFPDQQVADVCIHCLKRETETNSYFLFFGPSSVNPKDGCVWKSQ